MTTAELDARILAALTTEPIGIRELAGKLGLKVKQIQSRIHLLEIRGRIHVLHPSGGYNPGSERRIALPAEVAHVG